MPIVCNITIFDIEDANLFIVLLVFWAKVHIVAGPIRDAHCVVFGEITLADNAAIVQADNQVFCHHPPATLPSALLLPTRKFILGCV